MEIPSLPLDYLQLGHPRQLGIYISSYVSMGRNPFLDVGLGNSLGCGLCIFIVLAFTLLLFPCVNCCIGSFWQYWMRHNVLTSFSCNYINMYTVHGDLGMLIRTSVMINGTVNESWFLNCKALEVTLLICGFMQMTMFENVAETCHCLTYQR